MVVLGCTIRKACTTESIENNKVEKSILTATKSEMSIENEGGWALRHPVVVCCVQVIILSVLLFLLAKNAAALGYHGYHIIEDIMVSASDITLAEECWGERWGAISGCRREGMVW